MIINFNFKQNNNVLNILFLLIPVLFLLPVNFSNIFCIIYLLTTFFFLKKNELNVKTDIIDIILFFFFCIIITSSLIEMISYNVVITGNLLLNIVEKVSVIRFFFLYWLTKNILQYNLIRIESFFKVSLFCIIFISTNIILMHLIGYDIFGNKETAERFSTIFGDRAIAGTYILNFFFFGFIYIYYLNKNNIFITFFFFFFLGLGILLTLDRMPFILFITFFFFICLLNLKKNYKLLTIFFIITPIFIFLILKYEKLSTRLTALYGSLHEMKVLVHNTKDADLGGYYSYASIFKESTNIIFFEKTLIGSGKSSFNSRCRDYRLQTDIRSKIYGYAYACQRHTHHLYLEILISGGVLGFITFIIAIIIKFFVLIKNILLKKNSDYIINSILLTAFLVEIFPLRTYGNIFNSYTGLFFFFKISIIYSIIKYNILKLDRKKITF